MMIGLLLHSMRPAAFSFAIIICLFLLFRHRCAGIFCFYLESGEVLRKKIDGSVLVSPRGKLQQKEKTLRKKPQCLLAQKERLDRALPCLFAARTIPLYVPFCCAKRWTIAFSSLPGGQLQTKRKDTKKKTSVSFGAEGETRTLAPVARPTPLAGAPRHQLEYFCILCCNLC